MKTGHLAEIFSELPRSNFFATDTNWRGRVWAIENNDAANKSLDARQKQLLFKTFLVQLGVA